MKKEKTPKQIFEEFENGQVDRSSMTNNYLNLIEKGKGSYFRAECIDFLGKIQPIENVVYKKVENIMLSDASPLVRSAALKLIIQFKFKEGLNSLKWVIIHDNSPLILKTVLLSLDKKREDLVIIENALLQRFRKLFGLIEREARFFLDLFKILARDEKYLNIEEFWNEDYWPSDIFEINERVWVAVKDFRVQALNLNDFNLNEIPKSIGLLYHLKRLTITENNLNQIPEKYFEKVINTKKEKYIDQGVNPEEAPLLALLELLNGQKLEKINSLKDLIGSMMYDLYHNMRNYMINDKGFITHIYLYSRTPVLGIIPNQLCRLKYLEELHMMNDNFKFIPSCIGNLTSLRVLNLMENKISNIPESMKNLRNLEELNLGYNKITNVPQFLKKLPSIRELHI